METEQPARIASVSNSSPNAERGPFPEEVRPLPVQVFWLSALQDLLARRRLIAALTLLALLGSVAGSLMLRNEYQAVARVLVPDQNSGLIGSLLGSGSMRSAARFLGSGTTTGQYSRHLAVLTSRTVQEAIVDSFQLVRVYETQNEKHPRDAARRILEEKASFGVDNEYEFLFISVQDESPERAAAMANSFVQILNRKNLELQTQNAAAYRRFIEQRYNRANADIDSLLDRVQSFQRRYGVIDLPAQTESYFTSLGVLRSQQARLQIELQMLRAQFGPDAPEVQAAQRALDEATRLYNEALAGGEVSLPVPRNAMPSVAREYAELERQRIQEQATIETLAPLYETARMEETRNVDAVQVVDEAVPPARKAWPKRSVIVLVVTLSTLLLACVATIAAGQWRRHSAAFVAHLSATAPAR